MTTSLDGIRMRATFQRLCQLEDTLKVVHPQTTGKNVRQSLEFCRSRLSKAGVHENAADAWVTRRQIIYDQRLVSSLVGASHFNLVSDASKHSGVEVLASVIFRHENQTAGCNHYRRFFPVMLCWLLQNLT